MICYHPLQIQFCILLCHGVVSLYVKCDYPLWMQYSLVLYMVSFLVLFSNFYIHSYLAQRHRKHERQVVEYENNKANSEAVANGDIVANGVASPYLKEGKKRN